MNEKQAIIAKMLELQHFFEKQPDGTSRKIVLKIKQAPYAGAAYSPF